MTAFFSFRFLFLSAAAFCLFVLPGCKTYFTAADFDQRTAAHKTVAVLPFEMMFTGVKPEKLSDADLRVIEEAESKAFMISLYNEILRSTKNGRKPLRVDVQHFDKTLNLLKANNVDIRAAWSHDPGQLAALLGVDAVVKARVQKHRLMSDLASYGIDIGRHILAALSDYSIWWLMPGDITKSKEVKTSYTLVDKDGSTLWSIAYNEEADWRQPANDIIDNINRKSAKRFPYRSR